MKLVMTMLVRDEEDIIGYNVGFHLERGVDLVLVTDNGSLDGTRDALAAFERDGAVRVVEQPDDDYRQSEWVTLMARQASQEHGADWVLHCDADEFWWTDDDLPSVLTEVPVDDGVVIAPRHNFVPNVLTLDEPFYRRMTVRDTQSCNVLGIPLFGKCGHRGHPSIVVAQGNHCAEAEGLTEPSSMLAATVLHFPVRSYAQFERKVVLGGRAYARNRDLPWTTGNTWRVLYAAYLEGRLQDYFGRIVPSEAELQERLSSGRYVVDERLCELLTALSPPGMSAVPVAERSAFPAARPARSPAPAGSTPAAVEVLLHDPDAGIDGRLEAHLVEFIDDAVARLDVSAAVVDACAVLAALDTARRRGVAVRILTADPAPLASWRLAAIVRPDLAVAGGPFVLRDGTSTWIGFAPLTGCGLHEGPAAAVRIDDSAVTFTYQVAFARSWEADVAQKCDEAGLVVAGNGRDPIYLADGEMFAVTAPDDHWCVVEGLRAATSALSTQASFEIRATDPASWPVRPLLLVDDETVVTGPFMSRPSPDLPAVTLVLRSRSVAAALGPLAANRSARRPPTS